MASSVLVAFVEMPSQTDRVASCPSCRLLSVQCRHHQTHSLSSHSVGLSSVSLSVGSAAVYSPFGSVFTRCGIVYILPIPELNLLKEHLTWHSRQMAWRSSPVEKFNKFGPVSHGHINLAVDPICSSVCMLFFKVHNHSV